jgi:predicted SAM-dependent methyltransferase
MGVRLNLACGSNKLTGFVNCDIEEKCNPDKILNFTEPFPYGEDTVEVIVLFHGIEHVSKRLHTGLLREFHRVLEPEGKLVISYPEFEKVAKNWLENYRGMREFWENTIYGLQRYPTDYHVALMHTPQFIELLKEVGFKDIVTYPEPKYPYNTVVRCKKGLRMRSYEDIQREEVCGG